MVHEFISRQLNNKLPDKALLTLIVVYPLLFIWQGLDFTDTGFILTNYQQMFIEPSSVESSFRLWLSNVLGGIWVYFFGDSLGLTGYRLVAVLLVYTTLSCSYLTLRPFISRRSLLVGLVCAMILINRSGYNFNYNSLTAFFFVLSSYLLIKGLTYNRTGTNTKGEILIFLAAFIMGLNIFIRLPNVMGFFIIGAIVFQGWVSNMAVKVQIRRLMIFLAGYMLAIAGALLAMYQQGHLEAYITSFIGIAPMLMDAKGHHSSQGLMSVIINLYKMSALKAGQAIILMFATAAILTLSARLKIKFIQYGIIALLATTLTYYNLEFYKDWYGLISTAVGVTYLTLLWLIFFFRKRNNNLSLVAFTALIVLVVIPLGSANGFVNSVLGMYLALPLALGYLLDAQALRLGFQKGHENSLKWYGIRLTSGEAQFIKILTVIIFFSFVIKSAYHFTYRDSNNRMDMVYQVEHSRLKGVYTTKERAAVVQELLDVLPRFVSEGDYLLAYEQISMVYFLTKTKPYLYGSWPMLYGPEKFRQKLDRAMEERPELPVVVRAKGGTENTSWPKYRKLRTDNFYLNEGRRLMGEFIEEKRYKVVWQNSFFEILLPEEEK